MPTLPKQLPPTTGRVPTVSRSVIVLAPVFGAALLAGNQMFGGGNMGNYDGKTTA
jgi:hypothetical protein